MTTYVNPYTGSTINPSQVGYENITLSTTQTLQWPINGNTSNVVANIIEVTATTTGLSLIMPSATSVSTGQSVLIRNLGSNPFTVLQSDGITSIVSISSGIAQYIYLTNNSTTNGTWSTVQFGAGTSAANASTLKGYGLSAVGTELNTINNVTLVPSSTTLTATAQSSLIVYGGGAGTITLPSASATGITNGWFVVIKNDGAGILNIATVGTDTIDGQANTQLQLQESLVIVSSGSNWYSYAYGQSASFFFTQLVLPVTGLGATITLTSTQSVSIIQEYTGTLAQNTTIILPQTVQFYSIQNKTSGTFTLTFSTGVSGGATVQVPQSQTIILICDGTNVYNAQTATSTSFTTISVSAGTPSTPSLNFGVSGGGGYNNTGIYAPASGQIGFAINGASAGYISSTGMYLTVGINGGAF